MVIPTDIQVSFVMASFFVDMGRRQIEAESRISPERSRLVYNQFRKWALLNVALFLAPTIVVFFNAWPAWETQYWSSSVERLAGNPFTSLLAGLYAACLTLAALLGNYLSFRWIVRGRSKLLRPVYLTVLVVTVGIFLWQWPAPIVLGTVAGFKADPYGIPFIWEDFGFFIPFCLLLVYCFTPVIFVFFSLPEKYRPLWAQLKG